MNGGRKEYQQSAEKLLRKAYKNSNRKRSLVLALTSGMLMLLGMLLLGFIQGEGPGGSAAVSEGKWLCGGHVC